MRMEISTLLETAAVLGVGGVLGTAAKALFERKTLKAGAEKTGMESTSLFVDTAESLLLSVRGELDRVRTELGGEVEKMRNDLAAIRRRESQWFARAEVHAAWDRQARAACPDLPPCPPLFPPTPE